MNIAPRSLSVAVPILLALTAAPLPMFAQPQALPADRIIRNLQARLKKTPKDAHLIYTLARVNYLSFVNQSALIPGFAMANGASPASRHAAAGFLSQQRYEQAGKFAMGKMGIEPTKPLDAEKRRQFTKLRDGEYNRLVKLGWVPKPLDKKTLRARAHAAMTLFDRAINLAPDNPLYHLGRASLADQVLQLVAKKKLDKPLPGVSTDAVRGLYFKAFTLAFEPEHATGEIPIAGLEDLVSHEAGQAYLRLAKMKKGDWSDKEKARVATVRKGLAKLRKMRRGPITPILIGKEPGNRVRHLVDPFSTVYFDLDGDGVKEHWPWVKPDTGILVWAPPGTKSIASGRQLFGSVTFFLFHRDGYEALSLLDDDQDGELRGMELDGLAIWYDRDGDGRSNATELVSAWDAGIDSITASADDFDGRAPMSTAGIRYSDGRVVPTIDWITERR